MASMNKNAFGRLMVVLIANTTSITVCFLGLVIISNLVLNQTIGETGTNLAVSVLLLSAVFAGEQVLSRYVGKVLMYSIVAGSSFVLLTVLGGLMMDGCFQNPMRNLVVIITGTALSVAITRNGDRRRNRRKFRYR